MSEIEAQNRRRFYVYSSWIPVIPAGISGGMESIEKMEPNGPVLQPAIQSVTG